MPARAMLVRVVSKLTRFNRVIFDIARAAGRGGQPDAQDRVFATQCGVEAALGCLEGEYGFMVAQRDGEMRRVPLAEVAGKLKRVDPASDLVREARALGISFGDEA